MPDDLLEDRLRNLGEVLEFVRVDTLVEDVLEAIDGAPPGPSWWRRPLLVAAALVVVVAVSLVATGSRETIARWLGFDELRIERVPFVAPTLGMPLAVETPLDRYVVVRYREAAVVTLPGTLDGGSFRKLVAAGAEVSPVDVSGRPGYWITGEPHVFMYVDDDGVFREARPTADTLAWQLGDVIVRIEGDISLERALEIAASIREP